jgi:hypothetical protein
VVNSAFAGDLSNFGMQNVVDCVVKRGAFAVKAWLKTPANSARLKQAKSLYLFRFLSRCAMEMQLRRSAPARMGMMPNL